jgi:hypothetical protein
VQAAFPERQPAAPRAARMASCRARAAARHDHVSMRRRRRRSMPSGRYMARPCAFTAGISTISPRVVRCRRRAGRRLCVRRRPRTVWAPSAENRSWRTWPAICAAIAAAEVPIGGELDALEATAETAARNPDVFTVSRSTGKGGAGPGRPVATFRRQCRSAADGCSCSGRVTGGGSCNAIGADCVLRWKRSAGVAERRPATCVTGSE